GLREFSQSAIAVRLRFEAPFLREETSLKRPCDRARGEFSTTAWPGMHLRDPSTPRLTLSWDEIPSRRFAQDDTRKRSVEVPSNILRAKNSQANAYRAKRWSPLRPLCPHPPGRRRLFPPACSRRSGSCAGRHWPATRQR